MKFSTITDGMRNVLIDHIDGTPNPIIQPASQRGLHAQELAWRILSVNACLARGLLKTDGSAQYRRRPEHTIITESGRAALARLLAEYAEVLLRAGRHVEELRYIAGLPEPVPVDGPAIAQNVPAD